MKAAYFGKAHVVEALLEAGADTTTVGNVRTLSRRLRPSPAAAGASGCALRARRTARRPDGLTPARRPLGAGGQDSGAAGIQ